MGYGLRMVKMRVQVSGCDSHGVYVADVDAILGGGHREAQDARVNLQHFVLLGLLPFALDFLVVRARVGARIDRDRGRTKIIRRRHHSDAQQLGPVLFQCII